MLFFNSPEFCWFISTKLTISANYRSHFVSFRHNHCINTLISTFCLSDQTWHSFELKRWVDLVWHSNSCFLTELIIWANWPASSVITVEPGICADLEVRPMPVLWSLVRRMSLENIASWQLVSPITLLFGFLQSDVNDGYALTWKSLTPVNSALWGLLKPSKNQSTWPYYSTEYTWECDTWGILKVFPITTLSR